MKVARWTRDELEWARECWRCGDTHEEIAEWSGRSMAEVIMVLGSPHFITPTEREVLNLYMAGLTFPEIDRARGVATNGKAFSSKVAGKAAAVIITHLRKKKGLTIPRRSEALA